jgi:hypothetical protein
VSDQITAWLKIKLPRPLLDEFLQLIRTFESRRPDEIHVAATLDCQSLTAQEIEETQRRIKPMLPYLERFDKF